MPPFLQPQSRGESSFGRKFLFVSFLRLKYITQAMCCSQAQALKMVSCTLLSMLTAITRAVSPGIVHCELTFVARQAINLEKAEEQHRAYQRLLEKSGARVISLPAEPELPHSMFV